MNYFSKETPMSFIFICMLIISYGISLSPPTSLVCPQNHTESLTEIWDNYLKKKLLCLNKNPNKTNENGEDIKDKDGRPIPDTNPDYIFYLTKTDDQHYVFMNHLKEKIDHDFFSLSPYALIFNCSRSSWMDLQFKLKTLSLKSDKHFVLDNAQKRIRHMKPASRVPPGKNNCRGFCQRKEFMEGQPAIRRYYYDHVSQHIGLQLIVNQFPVNTSGHFLLVCDHKRERVHIDQKIVFPENHDNLRQWNMDDTTILDLLRFFYLEQYNNGYTNQIIGFNGDGFGMSVNHFHAQYIPRPMKELLPLFQNEDLGAYIYSFSLEDNQEFDIAKQVLRYIALYNDQHPDNIIRQNITFKNGKIYIHFKNPSNMDEFIPELQSKLGFMEMNGIFCFGKRSIFTKFIHDAQYYGIDSFVKDILDATFPDNAIIEDIESHIPQARVYRSRKSQERYAPPLTRKRKSPAPLIHLPAKHPCLSRTLIMSA